MSTCDLVGDTTQYNPKKTFNTTTQFQTRFTTQHKQKRHIKIQHSKTERKTKQQQQERNKKVRNATKHNSTTQNTTQQLENKIHLNLACYAGVSKNLREGNETERE